MSCIQKGLGNSSGAGLNSFWPSFFISLPIGALVGSITVGLAGFKIHFPTAIVFISLFVLLGAGLWRHAFKARNAFDPSDKGMFLGEYKYTFNEAGFESEGKGYKSQMSWSLVIEIARLKGMIFIFIDTANAFIFPEAQLENPDEFYQYVTEQHAKAVKLA